MARMIVPALDGGWGKETDLGGDVAEAMLSSVDVCDEVGSVSDISICLVWMVDEGFDTAAVFVVCTTLAV